MESQAAKGASEALAAEVRAEMAAQNRTADDPEWSRPGDLRMGVDSRGRPLTDAQTLS